MRFVFAVLLGLASAAAFAQEPAKTPAAAAAAQMPSEAEMLRMQRNALSANVYDLQLELAKARAELQQMKDAAKPDKPAP